MRCIHTWCKVDLIEQKPVVSDQNWISHCFLFPSLPVRTPAPPPPFFKSHFNYPSCKQMSSTLNRSPKDASCPNSLKEKQQPIAEDVRTELYETDDAAGGVTQPLPLYVKYRMSYLGWPSVFAGVCLFSLFCLRCFSFRLGWRSAERRSTGDRAVCVSSSQTINI